MTRAAWRRAGTAAVLAAAALASTHCAVAPDGEVYGPSVGLGLDYYEPFGGDYGYGGWGPGYWVGPFHDGGHPGGGGPGRGFRPAQGGHAMPSLPSRGRSSGGGRGGARR